MKLNLVRTVVTTLVDLGRVGGVFPIVSPELVGSLRLRFQAFK